MDRAQLSQLVKNKAYELGFALAGIARNTPQEAADFYDWWTEQGYGGEMQYLVRHREKKRNIESLLPTAKAALICALPFAGGNSAAVNLDSAGKVARYAQGRDYHDILGEKLRALASYIDELSKPSQSSLAFVDSGPVNERALGAAAGIGWVGKNAMLINPEWGSWFWLGEVITEAPLLEDGPLPDRCGNCRRCLDACPTQAILEDKRAVDARRCISYLTIEKRGEIAPEFKGALNGWLLGCDICQEVCPWNHHSLRHGRSQLGEPPLESISLTWIASASAEEIKNTFKFRALSRAKPADLKRNAKLLADHQ